MTPPQPPAAANRKSPSGHRCRSATSPVRGGFPRGLRPRKKKAPLSKGAGRVSGLGDSDGLCQSARYPRRRPGIPPPRLRSAPPFDKGGFPRGLRPRKKAPLTGELAELARPEGSRRALRHGPSTVTRRQPPEPFRPASRPPPLMGRLLSRASPAQKAPLTGELAEPARPEGLCRTFRRRPVTPLPPNPLLSPLFSLLS